VIYAINKQNTDVCSLLYVIVHYVCSGHIMCCVLCVVYYVDRFMAVAAILCYYDIVYMQISSASWHLHLPDSSASWYQHPSIIIVQKKNGCHHHCRRRRSLL
jgi:hypothetical protein